MSAGAFTNSKYESNSGSIYRIRVQPETAAATIGGTANTAPAGAIDQEVSAQVSGGKRSIGMNARTISLSFTGSLPTGYAGPSVRIPVLQSATYDAWTATAGQTGTYLGVAVEVLGQSPETKR